MIDLVKLLGIARAEARLTRRLVRYWVFMVLAMFVAAAAYTYYSVLHHFFSSWSATVASINPRYLMGFLGAYYIVIMLAGLVFLCMDVRARDVRERMVEVLDARECTNVELLLGKLLGILVSFWVPVVVLLALIGIGGYAFNEPVEPWSMLGFATLLVIPAATFTIALCFLVTLLVGNRLLAAVLLLAALVGIIWTLMIMPVWASPLLDITGAYIVPFPSDLIPKWIDLPTFVQRIGILLVSLAMIWWAAAVHPRKDDRPPRSRALIGLALFLAGAALCYGVTHHLRGILVQKSTWRAAHQARAGDPIPDLVALHGSVTLDPGRGLVEELELRFRAPADAALDRALFSLNPGLVVSAVRETGGRALEFVQADGLLEIDLPASLGPGQETAVLLSAAGRPEASFSYLDAVKEPLELTPWNGQMFLLGYEPLIFERRFVALMPGVRWLPAAGPETGRSDHETRPADFFRLELEVGVPEGWLVAGPGRRHEGQGGAGTFRFAPDGPLPGVALIAGRFESRSTEIDGVQLEVLLHRKHAASLEPFVEAAAEIRTWLTERLGEVRELGLPYPYDGLTLVEVPGVLRGYGGGWRMDTTLSQPGLVLMRESSFPTARFDVPFQDRAKYEDREGGVPRAKREVLARFFENDFNGGNPFIGAARSFFTFQASGRGDAGLPLDFVTETLATRLIAEKQGYFSIHVFNSQDMNQAVNQSIGAFFAGQNRGTTVAEAVIEAATDRLDVWDAVLGVSLADLDPWKDPRRTIDVLTLKGGAMAQSMLDELGEQKAAGVLAELRRSSTGSSFSTDDVVAAGDAVDVDLREWLDVWIRQTNLPGFTVSGARAYRLPDDDGSPRYQMRVTVRNGESTAGLVRLEYRSGDRDDGVDRGETVPHRIDGGSALEIGVVTSKPPRGVRVVPYLSLNRGEFAVQLPEVDEERLVDEEVLDGARVVVLEPSVDEQIVVDDLDPGFRVEDSGERPFWRQVGGDDDAPKDQGLPVFQFNRMPSEWSRRQSDSAYGRYRHTMAVVRSGEGQRKAIFGAELPRAGSWRLEFHLPQRTGGNQQSGRRRLREFHLRVVDASGEHELTFDAQGGESGWNDLGTFELAAGEVRVEVLDQTEGRFVLADAVRWSPQRGEVARHGGAQ